MKDNLFLFLLELSVDVLDEIVKGFGIFKFVVNVFKIKMLYGYDFKKEKLMINFELIIVDFVLGKF